MSINYIDLLILVITIFSVTSGYKKGFLKTITGLFSIVLSLILAMTLYPLAANIIKNTPVYDVVYENTASVIYEPDTHTGQVSEFGAGKLNLPRDFTDSLQNQIDNTTGSVRKTIANTVATAAVKIVSMLLVFLFARLLLFLITSLAGVIKKLPIIGWGDSLLGALFGLFRGMLVVYILLAVVTLFTSASYDGKISRTIKQSEFAKVMYHHNVLLDFLYKD